MVKSRERNTGGDWRATTESLENQFQYDYYFHESLDPKYVLDRGHWPELRHLLGGKGLSLAIMMALKEVNVPSGFTLPTTLSQDLKRYGFQHTPNKLSQTLREAIPLLTDERDCSFADPLHPLALAARSGAAYSMPGAMDTILNIGITSKNLERFITDLGEKEAIECYHTFCFDWVASWLMIDRAELLDKITSLSIRKISAPTNFKLVSAVALRKMAQVEQLRAWLLHHYQLTIPDEPWMQIESSVLAIYRSYYRPEAVKSRQQLAKSDLGGTAVNVISMVYGNLGEISGSGVAFSHDPKTGKPQTQLEFKRRGIGGAVVAGDGVDFEQQITPELQQQLTAVIKLLEEVLGQPVDLEFVIENGKIYFIQFRGLRLAASAMIKFLAKEVTAELDSSHLTTKEQAELLRQHFGAKIMTSLGQRFSSASLEASRQNIDDQSQPHLLASGQPIGGRANSGMAVHSVDAAKHYIAKGQKVVVILEKLNDVSELLESHPNPKAVISVVTRLGSPSSHTAYVLGTENIAGVIGCQNLPSVEEGTLLSVDGLAGEVHWGQLTMARQNFAPVVKKLLEERKALGFSSWEAIVEESGLRDEQTQLEERVRTIIGHFQQKPDSHEILTQSEKLSSHKALTQKIINEVFPPEVLTEYHIIPVSQKADQIKSVRAQIRKKVEVGMARGYDVSIRSAFSFDQEGGVKKMGSNPWIMLKPGENERLSHFLSGQLPDWKYHALGDWFKLNDEHCRLTEVLIGYNHPGKLDEEHFPEHAVGVIRCPLTQTNLIEGALILDTPHLRSFEAESYEGGTFTNDNEIKFRLRLNGDEASPTLGFGANYLDSEAVKLLTDRLFKIEPKYVVKNLSVEELSLRNAILKKLGASRINPPTFNDIDLAEAQLLLQELVAEAEVPESLMRGLVNKRGYERTRRSLDQLISQYLEKIAPGLAVVETTMSRLNGFSSGISLEFQVGFRDAVGSEMDWMAVYGLKGLEEWLVSLV